MGCLWLTLADPDPPLNGQFLYSAGLIESVAAAGLNLTVLGLSRSAGAPLRRVAEGVDWILAEDRPMSRWSRIVSTSPMVALRCRVPDMEAAIAACLADEAWEAVVFDSIAVGWALPAVRRYCRRHWARLVYLAHNHESTVARELAKASRGWRRVAKAVDASKVTALEHALVRSSDLVTANTPEDCRAFAAVAPGTPVAFLPPGYGGPRTARRIISSRLPRRAVVVGSFDWPPKRISLEAFLALADPLFSEAGVELQVVGGAEPSYLAGLRRRFPATEFIGTVPDVRPYMADARLALVPDLLGGFKLKSLDYVFNRLPIFAMQGAVPGTPLVDGRSIRLFASHDALARGVVAAIDDFAALNAQQERAFVACVDRFDWHAIGRHFVERLRRVEPRAADEVSTPNKPSTSARATAWPGAR